jgi:hypothetical protein
VNKKDLGDFAKLYNRYRFESDLNINKINEESVIEKLDKVL